VLTEECLNLSSITSLDSFELREVIGRSEDNKSIFLLANVKHAPPDHIALVLVDSGPLNERTIPPILKATALSLEKQNDIYYSFRGCATNELKVDVVFPANEKSIEKYRWQNRKIVRETLDDYKTKTLLYIKSLPPSRIEWVLNILDGKKEQEDVLFRDPHPTEGFILLPDFKWNKVDTSALYFLAITNARGIYSVRDLTTEHLGMLKNLKEKSIRAVSEKYGVQGDQLRLYFHYLPSFYHLHVHVTHIQYTPPGNGIHIGKAILLDDVISNISLLPSYYQVVDLTFTLGEREELYGKYFAQK